MHTNIQLPQAQDRYWYTNSTLLPGVLLLLA